MRASIITLAVLAISSGSSNPIPAHVTDPRYGTVLTERGVMDEAARGVQEAASGGTRAPQITWEESKEKRIRWENPDKAEQHLELGAWGAGAAIVIGGVSAIFGYANVKGVRESLREDYKRKFSLKLWRDYCIKSGSQSDMCKMKQAEQFRGL